MNTTLEKAINRNKTDPRRKTGRFPYVTEVNADAVQGCGEALTKAIDPDTLWKGQLIVEVAIIFANTSKLAAVWEGDAMKRYAYC